MQHLFRHIATSIVLTLALLATPVTHAGDHPNLLISAADLPRLRHACGVGSPGSATPGWGKFGARGADYQALRAYFAHQVPMDPLPGELTAAAFLHLIDPEDPTDAACLAAVCNALRRPAWATLDTLELCLALDWCWPDLEPAARRTFMLNLRSHAEGLTPADSPLNGRRFRTRLAELALAIAIDEQDDPNPSWASLRSHLLKAGREYFANTFPNFVTWRSLSPTGPAVAPREESDTALAIELAGALADKNAWPEYQATVGRWLEHYLLATLEHPALKHNFLRDDGNTAPLTPAPHWRELLPLTAHLIAARTHDPCAAVFAGRVEAAMHHAAEGAPWRWVPIVLDTRELERCNVTSLPEARNLGGAVIFRGGRGAETTAVWIDAAQPYLRGRQHFDAGHFLIYRGGHLAVDGGDDVTYEAVAAKGGTQRLGSSSEPFDFEQYFTATIAHNCVVCWDAARLASWNDHRYLPAGGQRPIAGTCVDFATPLPQQERLTGRQLAYGHEHGCAYLALDLTPAYDPRAVAEYTREFVFVGGRALVVLDRITLDSSRSPPTWVVNLPSRPQVDGRDLEEQARYVGSTNNAGVWRYDDAGWLRWTDGDGALWLSAPLPDQKHLRIVGGPAESLRIPEGPHSGRRYVGGDERGFERLIIPAESHNAENTWYRLGAPTLLGAEFGATSHWGRIEIEPATRARTSLFLTVLITDRADAGEPPRATLTTAADGYVLNITLDDRQATLRVPAGMERGGSIEITVPESATWTLPTLVQPDPPLRRPGATATAESTG